MLLPVTFAYEQFDSNFLDYFIDGILGAAFVPGVEVQIPVSKNWILKPFGQIGIGSYVVVSRFLDTVDFFGINGKVSQRMRTLVQIGLTLNIDPSYFTGHRFFPCWH